ncbi:hypothetical protein M758_10G151800 [Ceratodon purpureus]|nr:hypothetical protein M758_10G151800 [Ceratodon purpureus]
MELMMYVSLLMFLLLRCNSETVCSVDEMVVMAESRREELIIQRWEGGSA